MKISSRRSFLAPILLALVAPALFAQLHTKPIGRFRKYRPEPAFETAWRGFDTGTHSTAEWPYAGRVSDLDGDGRPDLAVVNWWASPKVGVLLNRGEGRLAPPVFYDCARGSLDLVVADLNADRKPDIVVSNYGSSGEGQTISVFRNLGGGTFAPQQQVTVGSGSFVGPVGLAAADFSGDGRVDIAVALYGYIGQGSQVALLVNNGSGGFLPVQSFPAGAAPYKLAAGDLTGDGLPDLVVARDASKLSVLRNTGGGFALPVSYDVLTWFNTNAHPAAELGDLDRDGDLDVVYTSSTTSVNFEGAIAVLRNQGNGALSPAEAIPLPSDVNEGGSDLAIGDVDGDGWPEILAATSDRWTLARNDRSGHFLSAETYGATEIPVAVELADMDGNGWLDPVVVGRESLEAAVYANRGDGRFDTPAPVQAVNFASIPSTARGISSADVDGDGDLDVAVAYSLVLSYSGGVSVLLGNGNGGFSTIAQYPSPLPAIYAKLVDLDGDDRPDLLWADDGPPYDVKTRRNLGDGSFGPIANWAMNTCGNGEVDAFDVDGDGDRDIVLCEYAGCPSDPLSGRRVYIRRNNGDATFQAPSVHIVSGFPERVCGADVNADGRMDLLVTGNSWIDVSLGNGNGTFEPPIPAACDWGPKGFCVADLDSDGKLDLATTNWGDVGSGGESVSFLRGNGNGTFQPHVTKSASYSATLGGSRDIVSGDADGDGDLDVIAGNYGSLDVSCYENLSGGSFAAQLRFGTGWNTEGLVFGDFDGDGRGDLLTQVSYGTGLTFRPALVLLKGR